MDVRGSIMTRKMALGSIFLGAAFLFLAAATAKAFLPFLLPPMDEPVGKAHEPILEVIAAQTEIRNGNIWKIYIRATDPDGDLDKIQFTFGQLGASSYSPDTIYFDKKVASMNGSISVWANLNGGGASGTIYGTVEVLVEDRAGNMSNSKTIMFEVQPFGPKDTFAPPPGINANVDLGQVDFPLQTDLALVGDDRND